MAFGKKKEDALNVFTYADPDLDISLEVPEGWDGSENQFFTLFLAAPAEAGFRANLGINSGSMEPPTLAQLQQLFEQAYAEQQRTQLNYKSVKTEKFEVDDCPALLRQTERTEETAKLDLTQIQVLLLAKSGLVYNISASCLRKNQEKYLPAFNHIIKSIKFAKEG